MSTHTEDEMAKTSWQPTSGLRFVERGATRILQQQWAFTHPSNWISYKWRDVPLEGETL